MVHDSSDQIAARDVTAQGTAYLAALARAPRAAGSATEGEAREYCVRVLRDAGFDVVLEPFDYSQLPGRYGTPVGAAFAWITVVATSWLGASGKPAFFVALVCLAGLAILGIWAWQMLGDGVLTLPWLQGSAVNLVATRRGGPTPRIWLVAHLDSKSQPIPSALRVAGLVALATAVAFTIATVLLTLAGAELRMLWWIGAVLATAGAIPAMASVVGNDSDGALDNASGVATVLEAVQSMEDPAVGVLLPSAEELGLAGARAWARHRHGEQGIAINCDGVDDAGALTIMYSGMPSTEIIDAIRHGAHEPVRVRRMPLGLLLDSVALTEAGWRSVTVSRGSFASLRRVHTRHDSLERLRGDGISQTATVLARAAEALTR